MLIKMICGTYGSLEDGVVTAKTNQSPPFEVEEKRAMQLIASGYALPAEQKSGQAAGQQAEQEPSPAVTESAETDTGQKILADYSYNELKRKAKELGISAAGTKEQLVKRIEEALASGKKQDDDSGEDTQDDESGEEDAGGEEPPMLQPAEPE